MMANTGYEKTEKTIGIPRAMSYYWNYPFYYGFFTALGIKPILSDKTTTRIINMGVEKVVSDTCFPIKVYLGHLINLLEKGCDTIFVPSLQSSSYKINNCSKIRGLPEIVRNVIDKPFKMIEPTIDKTEGISLRDFCFDIAHDFEVYDEEIVNKAIKSGWTVYNNFHKMTNMGINYEKALKSALNGELISEHLNDDTTKPLSVVIMAHGYNLFDERISMNLIKKLESLGVKVYTSLNVDSENALKSIRELGEIQYWANELELTGTAAYYMLNKKIDGILALSAFGCGPDSLMAEEISYHAKERNIPMIHLNIDEHTGEAGFNTRIEAFVDMIFRKKRKKLSSYKIVKNIQESAEKKTLTAISV